MEKTRPGMLKRGVLHLLQSLATATFIGIAVYGAITYWGGETNQKIPMSQSLLLGGLAVICIAVVVYIGGIQDTIAAEDAED